MIGYRSAPLILSMLFALVLAGNANAKPIATLAQPPISPDGHTIAFANGGDIWSVAARGGAARVLISGMVDASRPLYSPDGKQLAFETEATGNGDIYILSLASNELRRITHDDGEDSLSAWLPDSRWLYLTSARDNIGNMGAVYRVRVSGGTPMPVSLELYRNEEEGVPSPDGDTIALVGEGWGSTQWWRHGRARIDAGAIWLLRNDRSHRYQRLTPDNARALWPMWAANGKSLYYMSDRSGTENIWHVQRHDHSEAAVTHCTSGRVLWPMISRDGQTIAFQRGFRIWTLNTASGRSQVVPIKLRSAVAGQRAVHQTLTDDYQELALSPDGRKLVFIVHGEIFAAPSGYKNASRERDADAALSESVPAERVTHTGAAEFDVA